MPGFSIGNGSGESNITRTVRSHRWKIKKFGPLGNDPLGLGPAVWYAKSFGFPEVSSKVIEVEGAAISYKYAGRVTYSTANVTFYDMITPAGTSYGDFIDKWFALVHGDSSTGETSFTNVGMADDYKHLSTFELEAATDSDSISAFEISLHNSWPSKVSHTELDYSNSNIGEVSVELTFDWFTSKNIGTLGTDTSQGPLLLPPGSGFDI